MNTQLGGTAVVPVSCTIGIHEILNVCEGKRAVGESVEGHSLDSVDVDTSSSH